MIYDSGSLNVLAGPDGQIVFAAANVAVQAGDRLGRYGLGRSM